jgi:hypothetical protein
LQCLEKVGAFRYLDVGHLTGSDNQQANRCDQCHSHAAAKHQECISKLDVL